MKNNNHRKRDIFLNSDIIAFLLIALYLFFFGLISILKYNSFSYNDFDLAVHAQTLYNILHGSIESSILGVPFLGNHLNFILFLIAPIYAIFKNPITLLLLQTMALGCSGYPIYLIAKEELPKAFSLVLLFSYLFYPCIGYINLYEFHPTVFATFFISAALYFMYKNRFKQFIIFVILALLCQENIPLVIGPLGVYLFIIKKPSKWWFSALVISGLWFWVGAYKLIPYFGKGAIKFIGIYGYLGNSIGEVFINSLTHPIKILTIAFSKNNLIYLTQIFGPVAFLPVLSPISFLPAIPTLFQHLLSLRTTEQTIYYHYTAEIIPFVFFASLFALKRVLSFKGGYKKSNFLVCGLLAVTIGANWILGPHINQILNLGRIYNKTDLVYIKQAFLEMVPKDSETVATFEFLPKLSNRKKLYSLHHAVMGTYTLSNLPYELPKTTEYAIVDFWDWLTFRGSFYVEGSGANLRRLFADNEFGVVNMLDTIVLFKKGFDSGYYLYKILPNEPPLADKLSAGVNGEIELIGYEADKIQIKKGVISFKFYWRCLKTTQKTYGAFLDVFDERGSLRKQASRFICYRAYPTNEWKQGEVIEELYRLILPIDLPSTYFRIKMGIFDFYTGEIQKVDSAIISVVDNSMMINLVKGNGK